MYIGSIILTPEGLGTDKFDRCAGRIGERDASAPAIILAHTVVLQSAAQALAPVHMGHYNFISFRTLVCWAFEAITYMHNP